MIGDYICKRLLIHLSSVTVSLDASPISLVQEQACTMSIYESPISVAVRSEGDSEKNLETALRKLERASTINTNTPTSISIWDLSKPYEGEKQIITWMKVNKPSREYVKGEDHTDVKFQSKLLAHEADIDVSNYFPARSTSHYMWNASSNDV